MQGAIQVLGVFTFTACHCCLLLYAVESTAPAKQVVRMMDRHIDVAVQKIFKLSCFEDCRFVRSRVCQLASNCRVGQKQLTVKFMSRLTIVWCSPVGI